MTTATLDPAATRGISAADDAVGSLRKGEGRIELARDPAGRTRVVRSAARQPLKLLAPQGQGRSASIYVTTYGGGLVSGDQVQLNLTAGEGTAAFLTSQSATKVFRSVGGRTPCRQSLSATLAAGALLVAWPDPVICFEGAQYVQDQQFELQGDAVLVVVDWQTSGRIARGERWAFDRYQSRNRVTIDGRLVVNDALLLESADGPLNAPFRAGRFDCFASLIVIGQGVAAEADLIATQVEQHPVEPRAATLATASRIPGAGTIVRILGRDPHAVGRLIHDLLAPVTARLGEDPWSRKW